MFDLALLSAVFLVTPILAAVNLEEFYACIREMLCFLQLMSFNIVQGHY